MGSRPICTQCAELLDAGEQPRVKPPSEKGAKPVQCAAGLADVPPRGLDDIQKSVRWSGFRYGTGAFSASV